MQVATDEALGVVTIRHATRHLVVRAFVLVVVGIGLPVLVRATAPGFVVLALLPTAATAFWLVQGVTAVLVMDAHGIAVSASRRGRRHLDWGEVSALRIDDGHVTVVAAGGRTVTGPPGDDRLLTAALADADRLQLLPPRLR